MRIGELSRRTGVNPHQLRYYEAQGLLEPDRKTNGYREYADEAVRNVTQIRKLLDAGLSTREIEYLLPCVTGETPDLEPCAELLDTLQARLRRLDEHIATLTRTRTTLHHLLDTTAQRVAAPTRTCESITSAAACA